MIGNGLKLTWGGSVFVTGDLEDVTTAYRCFNAENFTSFIFLKMLTGMNFDDETGELVIHRNGLLRILTTLNLVASVAASELIMITQLYNGSGWINITPRKQVLTAIKPQQIHIDGHYQVKAGYRLRFIFASNDGKARFKTEMIGTGEYETELCAAVLNFVLLSR